MPGALSGVPPEHDTLEEVIVSVTPLFGTGVSLNHVPSNVQTLRAAQIDSDHAQALTDSVNRHLSGVTLADTEGDAFQQDLVARGFIVSPVLGTPQGLARYQNAVRINEAFGDIVLWDLVPAFAISQLQELHVSVQCIRTRTVGSSSRSPRCGKAVPITPRAGTISVSGQA